MPLGLDISEDNPRLPDLTGLGAIVLAVVFLAGVAVLVAVFRALPHLFTFLDRAIANKTDFAALSAVAAVVLGVSLYYLRIKMRWLYATLELCFAFATAWVAVTRLHSQGELSVWFGFLGSAYLVVRGLDNAHEARKQQAWPWRRAFNALTGASRSTRRRE